MRYVLYYFAYVLITGGIIQSFMLEGAAPAPMLKTPGGEVTMLISCAGFAATSVSYYLAGKKDTKREEK